MLHAHTKASLTQSVFILFKDVILAISREAVVGTCNKCFPGTDEQRHTSVDALVSPVARLTVGASGHHTVPL